MLKRLFGSTIPFWQRLAVLLLPLLTAALMDVVSLVFFNKLSDTESIVQTLFPTLLLFTPFFLSHYLSEHLVGFRSILIWFIGFILYPLMLAAGTETIVNTLSISLTSQSVGFAIGASVCHKISLYLGKRKPTTSSQWISRVLSLNSVVALLLLTWATLLAGVFVSTVDPMNNQPIAPIIRSDRLLANFGLFFSYWLQFVFLALLIAFVYWLNRYVLIRKALAQHGIFIFVVASLFSIVVVTPILASLGLLVPLNEGSITLIPSGNLNPFDPINFQIFFVILAVSTPVILAFERQQQSTTIESIARQQTLTELKLLQQQINPHFLFNTLNNLYALTLNKSDQAPDLLMKLADLLRYSVYEGQKSEVNLAKEVAYLQNYIALQKIRLGDKCEFNLEWPNDAEHWSIPPLLLIILLENAFKHGVEKSKGHSSLTLSLTINNGQLTLCCENPVPDKYEDDNPGGLGLENLRRRLALIFPGHFQLISECRGDVWYSSVQFRLSPC